MKKLLFLSAACWLAACEGPIFGSKKAPTFVIESPYADEQVDDARRLRPGRYPFR